jgi:hypothetical protein
MLSEQDVDQELKAALSVSPSPGFEARVLQRVEAERPSRRVPYGWLAAAASLVIAAGVVYALKRTPSAPPPARQVVEQTAPRAPIAQPDIPVPARTSTPASDAPRAVVVRASSRATRSTEPEVIVPVNQMEAVRRLVRAVNEGRIEVPVEPPDGPMAPPPAVTVTPVAVAPIPLPPLDPAGETATPFIRRLK